MQTMDQKCHWLYQKMNHFYHWSLKTTNDYEVKDAIRSAIKMTLIQMTPLQYFDLVP